MSGHDKSQALAKKKKQPPAVNAQPMVITGGGSMPSDEYRDTADAAETAEQQDQAQAAKKHSTNPIVFQIGNQGERAAAQRMIDEINGYRPNLLKGVEDGLIEPSAVASNTDATLALGDFLVSAGEQNRTLTDFQQSYKTAKLDVARFSSQVALIQKQNPGIEGSFLDAWGGEKELSQRARGVSAGETGQGATHWTAMQGEHKDLEEAVNLAASAQNMASAARLDVTAALNDIEAGVPTTEKKSVEGSEVLQQTAGIKKILSFGVDKAFEHFEIPGKAIADKAVEAIVDEVFAPQLRVLEGKTKESSDKQSHGATQAQVDRLRSTLAKWASYAIAYHANQQKIQTLKANMRDSSRQFAASAENKDEFEVGIVAEVYAEADALLQQLTLAIGLGRAEASASTGATDDRKKAVGDKQGLSYYEPDKTWDLRMRSLVDPRSVGWSYDAIERHVFFSSGGLGGTEGDQGVNPVMKDAIADLVTSRDTVQKVRDRLASSLGFSKSAGGDASAEAAAGPK